jgi:hypothetical protein
MTINTSDLDFNDIKSKLKTYLRNSGEFEDFDFNTSGISNILDVLAYNTHINALVANLSINESFLSTSQIRTSVVGHAESLGYTVKSRTAARATVGLEITIENPPSTFTLSRGSEFFASIDDVGYRFLAVEDHTTQLGNDGKFTFNNIQIAEGKFKTRTFVANQVPNVSYVIMDENIDTSTISVHVYENGNSTNYEVYQDLNTVSTIDDNSRVYMVGETPSGNYEIFFSDGNILGKRPKQGNIIEVSYISTKHVEGNGAKSYSLNGFEGVSITSSTTSAGGSDRESLDSIKLNAPRSYTTQNRLVTADDYTALIMAKYSNYLRDAIAWGGNDNVPPEYGKVFVSLNFQEDVDDTVTKSEKSRIQQELTSNLSIMSIDLELVDPELTYLEIQTVFNVDALKSNKSQTLETDVQSLINAYIETELSTFNSTFRRSNLLAQVDNLSPAILNSRMTVKVQQRIPVTEIFTETGLTDKIEKDFHVNFPVFLAEPDNDDHTITSSVFKSNGQNVIIKNKLGSTKLQLLDMDNIVKIDNIGSYEPARGTVTLNALTVDENSYVDDVIKISATPANQSTIVPLRNYILTLDSGLSTTRSNLDTGAIKVEL